MTKNLFGIATLGLAMVCLPLSGLAQHGDKHAAGGTCPVTGKTYGPAESTSGELAAPAQEPMAGGYSNSDWWPNQLDLGVLHQNSVKSNPMGGEFDYAAEFNSLDLAEVKRDIAKVLTDSQDWWPADYGHYGPLFIRMAWHSAGTYRVGRRPWRSQRWDSTICSAKQLAGQRQPGQGPPVACGRSSRSTVSKISWADLMVLAGNVSLESMGFKTMGFRRRTRGCLGTATGYLLGT